MANVEIRLYGHNGRKVPGARTILVDGISWGVARSQSQRGVWVIRNYEGREIGHIEPTGGKSKRYNSVNDLLLEKCTQLLNEGTLIPPPSDKVREEYLRQQAEAKKLAEREKLADAAPEMLEALEFIMDNGLLQGPYHLQDQAKRKVRVALAKGSRMIDHAKLETLATPERAEEMYACRDRVHFCQKIVEEAGLPKWQGRTLEAYLSNLMEYGVINPLT